MISGRQAIVAVLLAGAAFAAGALIFGDGGDSSGSDAASSSAADGLLYVQTASAGAVENGRLVMTGPDPRTTAFAERPARDAARLSTREFVRNFDAIFGDDPPNGTLTVADGSGERVEVALKLSEPELRSGSLTYAVEADQGDMPTRLEGPASLFIDDSDSNIWTVTTTDSNGTPQSGIEIEIVKTDDISTDGFVAPASSVATATTDSSGSATLIFSGEGSYTAQASSDGEGATGTAVRNFGGNTMTSSSITLTSSEVAPMDTD